MYKEFKTKSMKNTKYNTKIPLYIKNLRQLKQHTSKHLEKSNI
jgi:hypothetical protein